MTIRCWDCHAEVRVPRYRDSRSRPAPREKSKFLENWGDLVSGTVLLALLTMVAITIPRVGGLLALTVLTVGGVLYIKRIEEVGLAETEDQEELEESNQQQSTKVLRQGRRLLLGLSLAVGLSCPFWASKGASVGFQRPQIPGEYLLMIIAPILWIGLPLIVFVLSARGLSGWLGIRQVLLAIRKRPWTSLAALLILPATFLALEVILMSLLISTGWLHAFVFDIFPPEVAGNLAHYNAKILSDGSIGFSLVGYTQMYNDSLRSGFSLVGSIPLSLSRGLSPQASIRYLSTLTNESYLIVRMVISLVELSLIMAVLVIQASLWGRITRSVLPSTASPSPAD